jgi:hypothetical protein
MHMKLINTLLGLLAAVLLGLATPFAQADPTLAGYVTRVRGEVQTLTSGKTETLALGQALYLGARISTGADARLEARMQDGSVLTLGERTEFLIGQVAGTETQKARASSFTLLKGVFRAITGKLPVGQPAQTWQVRTPVAIIGVRGTELWGGMNLLGAGPDTLDVVMISGKGVFVENQQGITELKTAGDGTTVKGAAVAPVGLVPWGQKKLDAALLSVSW